MKIEFHRLKEIEKSNIIDLMNHPLVQRHMPLLKGEFTEENCVKFVTSKERMWAEHSFGPWAFVINNQFAGWGGIQPDDGEADVALVLHPDYWGFGAILFKKIMYVAFNEIGMNSIQVLFPLTRTRVKGLLRYGFIKDKEVEIGNERFARYILNNPNKENY